MYAENQKETPYKGSNLNDPAGGIEMICVGSKDFQTPHAEAP